VLEERRVSAVSGFLVQPMQPAARPEASVGLCGLSSSILHNFPSCEPTKPRGKGRSSSEARARIEPHALKSLDKSPRTNSRLLTRIATAILSLFPPCLAPAAFVCLMFAPMPVVGAQTEGLVVSDAWVPAVDEVGRDVPLLAAIRNEAEVPDALMRIRCPVANFFEKHTVDRGEGAPAMRPISAIPIPAGATVVLKPSEYHLMLLQIRQPLAAGERFKCTLVFQKAGAIETEVEVRRSP
jgi:periplasmic copper chaperone A